ncbi:MnmC family methyltransferase [Sphingobium yanoikuyae]|jgi:spermidine synthase|uniref:MnmC family methyltransferase n=2 Tax=Sphingobium yanoikuyae TaxID=13690 RepID=A0A0J9D1V6_SPHYA|nr:MULTISPECIES: MnmC family methyltransferase [Sphingobium]ATP18052.1 spermidine synthase [Sphingobium yanoikuyae]KMW30621.1 spermidine synthase [Sphingobium yanoikuyae]MDH2129766.1 MnmC family methyltransferase [Sphingobium yanoikuyae]MDH2148505.1 MnmC family methyltransferase [Sphingobium yanoikuyae]MDH2165029.1 MnmC family methyltransferase [Sphingobium yanoikuyae]
MTPRELLGTAAVPGGQELRLYRRGGDFMIVLDRNELMSSRMNGSEKALALMTLERLGKRAGLHMLIGGYGMGFTLRAALAEMDTKAQITLAELVPEIIEWARGPMVDLAAGCLDDPRVRLVMDDVAHVIAAGHGSYDAILLDVDNGPDGLTADANDRLYTNAGLSSAMRALKPGGILAIWSAGSDAAFTRRLQNAGFAVEEVAVKARDNGKGPRHVIWFATRRR